MSKERLEEIKEDVFKCNHGSTRGYSYEQLYHIALSLIRIHGEWLIEQAEQNKRYRDARKRIKQVYKDVYEISVEGHYKDGFLDGLDSVLEIIDWNNYKE